MSMEMYEKLASLPSEASLRKALAFKMNSAKVVAKHAVKMKNKERLKIAQQQAKLLDELLKLALILDNKQF